MKRKPKYLQKPKARKVGNNGEKIVRNTINSGAFWIDKGDLEYDKYLIEVKTTNKKGYRISQEKLKKIFDEAYSVNKEPLFVIVFSDFIAKILIEKR